ncbi:molybdopterin-binding protein, partial [Vibrio genomosp. F10 str. 9ZC157]
MGHAESKFQAANIAVLTVSDTRTEENDTSGGYLAEQAKDAGHNVVDKKIVIDDMYKIRAIVSQWIADETVQAVMITGG